MSDTPARLSAEKTEVNSPDHGSEKIDRDASATPEPQAHLADYPTGAKLVLIITSMCLAVFLVALDQTIIAPALGAITGAYNTVEDIGWYGSAYLLTTTALQPMYGAIYKNFNVKLAYLGAIFIFEIGSLICALAPSSTVFIVGRAVAGIGTAGLFSGSIVIISLIMPLEKRPLAFGLIAAMWGVASVAGPLLGGAFTESSVGWRFCFWVNLPIGAVACVIVWFFVKVNRNTADSVGIPWRKRLLDLDLPGTAIFIPAIVCLLLALQWGGVEYPWSNSRIIGLFVGFGAMIAVFIGLQLWQGDKGTLPPRLFKDRNVLPAMGFSCFFGAGFFPLIYYLSLYFQAIKGDSAVDAGIKILPLLLSTVIMSIMGGGIITAFGYYSAVAIPCMVLYTIGAGLITLFDIDTPLSEWFGFQVVTGLGIGAGFQVGVLVVQTVLDQSWVPVGTASVQFFQALGGAVAIGICQTLFQNGLIDELTRKDIGIDPQLIIQIGASDIRDTLEAMGRSDAIQTVLEAYMTGLRNTFYVSVVCAGLAFFCACALQWKSIKKTQGGASAAIAV